jgi:hypothetical protein
MTTTTIVGQRINLTAEIKPSGIKPSSHSWVIPEKIIKDFVTSPAGREPTTGQTVPVDGLNTATVSFLWHDGSFSGVSKQVDYKAMVEGVEIKGKTTFNVTRPTTSIRTVQTNTTNINYPSPGNGILQLYNPSSRSEGIFFSRNNTTIPRSFSGTFQFVQLIDATGRGEVTDGTIRRIRATGLDGCYPYALDQTNIGDNPNLPLTERMAIFQFGNFEGRWRLYLMFKPSGTDSVWVPLQRLDWAWEGGALLVANSNPRRWTPVSVTEPGSPTSVDTTEYPQWTTITRDRASCIQ